MEVAFLAYKPLKIASFVQTFWYLKISDHLNNDYIENIFPDGHHEIIFQLKNRTARRSTEENVNWIYEPTSFIAGQSLKSHSLSLEKGAILYGIRFHPHTLPALLSFPADSISGTIIDSEAFPELRELKNDITNYPETVFRYFEKVLIKIINSSTIDSNGFKAIDYSVSRIMQVHGNCKIDQLVKDTGFSGKYLDTLFKKYVGLSPKTFSRIVQFNHFIHFGSQHPEKSLTARAYEANFYDQSHLIKSFKEITGQLPKQYFRDPNYINNYFLNI